MAGPAATVTPASSGGVGWRMPVSWTRRVIRAHPESRIANLRAFARHTLQATDADHGNLLQHPGRIDPCRAALRVRPADRLQPPLSLVRLGVHLHRRREGVDR